MPTKSKSIDGKTDPLQLKKRTTLTERDENILRLGICAMRKKIEAKPMQEIIKRLCCKEFEIIIIDDPFWEQSFKVFFSTFRAGQRWMP